MITNRILLNKIRDINKSLLLLGPRQTGKSTLIRSLKPELIFNLAEEDVFVNFLRNPSLLKSSIKTHKKIFIDEVQRIPSLLNTAQSIIDADKSIQFFFTGSSARKLKRGQANLLPGRVLVYELGPLTHQELKEDFDLAKSLRIGLLPGVYWEESDELAQKSLRSYSLTYLKEEIQAEALTRNLEGFSRFFQIIASRSGNFIDFTKFSSQAMIEKTSAKRYFEILVDTLVVYPVEPYAKSKKRRLIQHPRYYFFDTGTLNGCLENFVASPDRIGNLFEHLFIQLLISSAKANDHTIRVSVYRTEAGAEVDFIVERGSEVFAVEVKASKNIGRHDLRGLKSFAEMKVKHQPLLVYLGSQELEIDGIPVLPLLSALAMMGYQL